MLRSVVAPPRQRFKVSAGAAGLLLLTVGPLAAADKLMAVDWSSEEIGAFVRERATAAPTPRTAEDAKLDKLKLPVLGFDRPPATVTNALAATARPELKRKVVMDDKNPVWYQIVDRYGDMVVKVEADLRVHQELPADTPIYGSGGPGASPQSSISVFDGRDEPGMEGAIAEYTVYKFPSIPYKVSIECPAGNTNSCRDLDTIAKDQAQLKVIAADPPRQ
jgi:hypothetical protein